jgi:hypothetical protein
MTANGLLNVSLASQRGIPVEFDAYALGATERATKNSTPDNPRTYFQLSLSGKPDGEIVYAFCEKAHAEHVATHLQKAGQAVPVTVSARLGRGGSLNVTDVAVSG